MQPDNTLPVVSSPDVAGKKKTRTLWIIGVVVIVVALLAGLLAWMLMDKSGKKDHTPPAVVTVTEEGFSPGTIVIKAGQDILWKNTDAKPHQIMGGQASAPNLHSDQSLLTGDSYDYTFEKKGTYVYYDPLNPTDYKGTVVVE